MSEQNAFIVAAGKASVAAELSHDMAVPLTSVIASLELLEERLGENPDPTVAVLLSHAARAASRMQRMLDQHLDLDTDPSGRTRVAVDLREVADELAVETRALLEQAGASLDIGQLPVVLGDPDAMYSVLQNLLTNAVKFAREGVVPRLAISATRVESGWRISVTDNGIGIPAQRRTDVFRPYARVDAHVHGHGIGLATVAGIVHALGGRVGVEEVAGGGAAVWFELPAIHDV